MTTARRAHRYAPFLLALLILALAVPTALAGDREERERRHGDGDLREIMEGLERGIHALRALGRHDEAERLLRVAREVGQELEQRAHRRKGEERELRAARHELEVYRIAKHAMREAERRPESAALERLIHALELALEGRHGEKAREAWKRAPDREGRIEILLLADRLWRKFENPENAEACEALARKFQEQARRRHGGGREREIAEHRIEVLRIAMKAMLEAERRDAAERLEHAVHALELGLEGRRDEEARRIRESAPEAENLVELLRAAAEVWQDFGHEKNADACRHLAEELTPRRREREETDERIQHLQLRLAELAEELDHLRAELEELRRDHR